MKLPERLRPCRHRSPETPQPDALGTAQATGRAPAGGAARHPDASPSAATAAGPFAGAGQDVLACVFAQLSLRDREAAARVSTRWHAAARSPDGAQRDAEALGIRGARRLLPAAARESFMAVAAALGRMRSGAATRQAALGGGAGRRLAELTESRGGRWLLGRSVEGELLLWDARHGYAEQRLARGVGCLPPHAFSLDEAWLVLPEGSGPAQVLASWDLTAPRRPTRVSGLPLPAAPATPAGPQVVDEAFVDALFDDLDPPVPPNRCQALAISQDGALVACAGADELLLYDLVTPWPQPTRRSYVDVIAMQFSTDGALWLQQSSTIRRLAPWETPELATVPPLATADGPATSGLTLAGGRRNGRCTVTATLDGVALWTAEVGTRRDSDPGAGPAQVSATRSRVVDWSPGTVAMVYDFGAPP